jgi:hypothetical protein
MSTLFRVPVTHYVDAQGKRVRKKTPGARRRRSKSKKWYVRYMDGHGIERREVLCVDKESATVMLAELVRKADRQRAGLSDPYEDHRRAPLADHIAVFREHLAAKDSTTDHVDQTVQRVEMICEESGSRRLNDLDDDRVATWLANARKHGRRVSLPKAEVRGTAKTYNAIGKAFGVAERTVTFWRQSGAPIQPRKPNDLATIDRWRREKLADRETMSVATSNHYLRAMKTFGDWLIHARKPL